MRTGTKKEINQKGLSLLEVLIATSLFFIFFTVFLSSQSDNILDSQKMDEELILHNLAENTINDILFSPPPLKESLLSKLEFKKFEQEAYKDYRFALEFLPLEIPESLMNSFTGGGEEDEGEEGQNKQTQAMKLLLKEFQKNIKKALWQVRVTVRNEQTGQEYFLSSFLRNSQYKIQFNLPSVPSAPSQGGP